MGWADLIVVPGSRVEFPPMPGLPGVVTWTTLHSRGQVLLLEMRLGRSWWVEPWSRDEASKTIAVQIGMGLRVRIHSNPSSPS